MPSTENQDLEIAIAPGSNFLQSATAQSIYCNPQSPYGQQIRQRHSATPVSCNKSSQYFTMQCNHQGTQTSHKIPHARSTQPTYKMKSKPCGIAVVISNEKFKGKLESRSGSAVNAHNLCNLFNYLGFDIQHHDNKTHTEMRHILSEVAAMNHDKYDCLMVAILTHGDYGDVLYGTTGGGIMIQEVIETFSGTRCPSLIGKPKIFIIQACRGRRHNQTQLS